MKITCTFDPDRLTCLNDHVIEGTIFVPMVVIIEEMARALVPAGAEAYLENIRIELPVMLRKNRAKELLINIESNSAVMLDEANNTYASLRLSASPHMTADHENIVDHGNREDKLLVRSAIYPDLMFHGPTFQADFIFEYFASDGAQVRLCQFDPAPESLERLKSEQRVAMVLLDLVFQVAGIHFMAHNGAYALPTAIGRLGVSKDFLANNVRVAARLNSDGSYNVDAYTDSDKLIMQCHALEFQKITRPLNDTRKRILDQIQNMKGA